MAKRTNKKTSKKDKKVSDEPTVSESLRFAVDALGDVDGKAITDATGSDKFAAKIERAKAALAKVADQVDAAVERHGKRAVRDAARQQKRVDRIAKLKAELAKLESE